MLDVFFGPREEIVHADNSPSACHHRVAQMRPDESCAPCDNRVHLFLRSRSSSARLGSLARIRWFTYTVFPPICSKTNVFSAGILIVAASDSSGGTTKKTVSDPFHTGQNVRSFKKILGASG